MSDVQEDIIDAELQIDDPPVGELVPNMTVSPVAIQEEGKNIISDESLLSVYDEIMNNIREDRKEVAECINTFTDMVLNQGDSTSASKEALVNLLKAKTDMSDKMSKIADLMTRLKMKDKDTFPRYLAAQQNNTINISKDPRQLVSMINKAKKKIAEKKENNV